MAQSSAPSYWAVFTHPTGIDEGDKGLIPYQFTNLRGLYHTKKEALTALVYSERKKSSIGLDCRRPSWIGTLQRRCRTH